jgi:hypothetical protein
MKAKLIGLFVVGALVLAFAFTVAGPAATHAKAIPAASSLPHPADAVPADHPEIRDAIASLRHAREHLEHAAHDYHGHREDALRATDEAIRQLEICLKFD